MKRCLVDVNVMLALVANRHNHHEAALRRFEEAEAGEWGLCRVVQLGLVRLLCNPAVMGGSALPAGESWRTSQDLLEDDRLSLMVEPRGLGELMPSMLRYDVPTSKLVTDAYLAAFSLGVGRKVLTMDRGFEQFEGIDLELLG